MVNKSGLAPPTLWLRLSFDASKLKTGWRRRLGFGAVFGLPTGGTNVDTTSQEMAALVYTNGGLAELGGGLAQHRLTCPGYISQIDPTNVRHRRQLGHPHIGCA